MQTKVLTILFLLTVLFLGCFKDEIATPIQPEVVTMVVDSTTNLEGIDLTTIKDFSRNGISIAPVFNVPTLSVSHTLMGVFKHEWFTKNGLDSIRMVKTSSGTAVLNGVTVANYNITLFYRGGFTIILPGYLARYAGESVQLLPTAVTSPLMNLATTQKRVIAERTNVTPKSVKHIYRPQTNTTVYPWRFSVDGVFSHQEFMLPEKSNTNTWAPAHII